MKFENSNLSNLLEYSKVEFSFGNFYLLDQFIISEINEDIHFGWENIEKVITMLLNHYGDKINIGYISNRIHNYSLEPQLWIDFQKKYDFILASAIVVYTKSNYMNASIEKQIFKKSIKRCESLEQAITWIKSLEELN